MKQKRFSDLEATLIHVAGLIFLAITIAKIIGLELGIRVIC